MKMKSMENITTILFDIDGTLLNTTKFILNSTEHSLKTHGHTVPSHAEIAKHVGKHFDTFYQILTGLTEVKHLQDSHREFQENNYHLSELYSNTVEVLTKFKAAGFRLGSVTSRTKNTVHATLVQAGIDSFFEVVITPQDSPGLKPDPAPLFKALELLGEKPEHALMVGDSNLDVEAGKNAGTRTARATYGFHTEFLHDPEPDIIIADIKDLLSYFNL